MHLCPSPPATSHRTGTRPLERTGLARTLLLALPPCCGPTQLPDSQTRQGSQKVRPCHFEPHPQPWCLYLGTEDFFCIAQTPLHPGADSTSHSIASCPTVKRERENERKTTKVALQHLYLLFFYSIPWVQSTAVLMSSAVSSYAT